MGSSHTTSFRDRVNRTYSSLWPLETSSPQHWDESKKESSTSVNSLPLFSHQWLAAKLWPLETSSPQHWDESKKESSTSVNSLPLFSHQWLAAKVSEFSGGLLPSPCDLHYLVRETVRFTLIQQPDQSTDNLRFQSRGFGPAVVKSGIATSGAKQGRIAKEV
ncbi:hypothetical protein TREES_T100011389 [Tupaia chinensis]|uniref:Uncharacterized protein n=1 Tax=Tupaia chinensis TaxID=246437 RepID=L9LBX8_TUPCH|nr:hypothetical protein TREES_T100011389 [Tupaia chinensis]